MMQLQRKSKISLLWKKWLLRIIYLIIGANIIAFVINAILMLIAKFKLYE
jgi:hypothetical protein